MMENASILAASAILSFGGVAMTAATPPNHALIWMNAGLQVCACACGCLQLHCCVRAGREGQDGGASDAGS